MPMVRCFKLRPAIVTETGASILTVTVEIWIVPGQRETFDAFEKQAFAIMRDHGAEVLEVRRSDPSIPDGPDEVHVLRFPSQTAFHAYRADARPTALAPVRASCIANTQIEIASDQG